MKFKTLIYFSLILITFSGCIGNDFVDDLTEPTLRISSQVDTIAIDTPFQFEAKYFNNIGREEMADLIWSSSDTSIISITKDGLANPKKIGSAFIKVALQDSSLNLIDSNQVAVGLKTTSTVQSIQGIIKTTSSYQLEGNFELRQENNHLILELDDNYRASTALPGLYIYLSNNRNTVSNALEIGAVQVFSGAHSYQISNVALNDYQYILYYCKPFNVKVGEGVL